MKNDRIIVPSLLVAVLLMVLVSWGCSSNEVDTQKPVIKLHDALSESQWVNNAIAEYIIENGYGYPVETVVESTPAMQKALPEGVIDLNLEGWQQNIPDWYQEQSANGSIINLGMTYEGGPQFFIIPKWVSEQYGIKSVQDMTA